MELVGAQSFDVDAVLLSLPQGVFRQSSLLWPNHTYIAYLDQ
jgi:hypothetical protein